MGDSSNCISQTVVFKMYFSKCISWAWAPTFFTIGSHGGHVYLWTKGKVDFLSRCSALEHTHWSFLEIVLKTWMLDGTDVNSLNFIQKVLDLFHLSLWCYWVIGWHAKTHLQELTTNKRKTKRTLSWYKHDFISNHNFWLLINNK